MVWSTTSSAAAFAGHHCNIKPSHTFLVVIFAVCTATPFPTSNHTILAHHGPPTLPPVSAMSTGVRRSTRIRKMRSVVDMYAPSESAAITVTENASEANKTPPKASKKGKSAKGKTSRSKKNKVSAKNANREASTSPEAPTAAVEDVTVRFSVEDDKENAGGASPVPGSPPTAKAKKGGRKGRAKAAKKSNTKAKAKTARRNTTRKSRTRRKSAGDQQTNDGDEAGEASDTNTGRRAGRRTGRKGTKERPQPTEDAEVKPDDVAAGNGESESGDVVAMDAVDTFTTPSPEKASPSRTGTESEADEDEQSPVVQEARSPSPQVRRSTRLARKTVSVVDEVAALEPRKRSAKKVDGSKGSGKKRTRSSVAAADDGIADGESDAALVGTRSCDVWCIGGSLLDNPLPPLFPSVSIRSLVCFTVLALCDVAQKFLVRVAITKVGLAGARAEAGQAIFPGDRRHRRRHR